MIQRIQTLYLLITVGLMAAVTFTANVLFTGSNGTFELAYNGVVNSSTSEMVYTTWPLVFLSAFTAFLAFVSILFFKKRMLQVRFSIFNLVLLVGYIPMLIYYIMDINKVLGTTSTYQIPVVFPAIAAIFTFLAIRAIGKDEALVRSLDRIR